MAAAAILKINIRYNYRIYGPTLFKFFTIAPYQLAVFENAIEIGINRKYKMAAAAILKINYTL
jgi:hypothetical protein